MVTGCSDVRAARRLIVEEYLEQMGLDIDNPDEREEIAWASRRFAARSATVETGRIVPTGPEGWDGYTWFWRAGYEPGKRGVTTAVVWNG